MAEKTYTGTINEFVDWITGDNSITKANVTGNLKASGASIRELISGKLQKPFVYWEDKKTGFYRMFSSQYTMELYQTDPDTYRDYCLMAFVRPSDYAITCDIAVSTIYLSKDSSNQTANFTYSWEITKGTQKVSDTIIATYKITHADGTMVQFSETYSEQLYISKTVTVNLYKYLELGNNTVNIKLETTNENYGASLEAPAVYFNLATLNLDSTFSFNKGWSPQENLTIPYTLNRSITGAKVSTNIYFTYSGNDGSLVTYPKNDSIPASNLDQTVSQTYSINYNALNLSAGQHSLQIQAIVSITNSDNSTTTFKSNIVYFTFTVKSDTALNNYFINVKRSLTVSDPIETFELTGVQYESIGLSWGYYTDNISTNTLIHVQWKLENVASGNTEQYYELGDSMVANKELQSEDLTFIPTIYTQTGNKTYLCGFSYNTETNQTISKIISIPITIDQTSMTLLNEKSGYVFKLSAFGKTNKSNNYSTWVDSVGNVSVNFNNMPWDNTNGWNSNSLRLYGTDSYATINYSPFTDETISTTGKTIEFEFESEKTNKDTDTILLIGLANAARIVVTPNSATLYDTSNNKVIKTNFKVNERIKLAFIINGSSTSEPNLIYIVNNGIIERVQAIDGKSFNNKGGFIKIGGSNSGIKFYNMRVYNTAITYNEEFSNYMFDATGKLDIYANNDIKDDSGLIAYDKCYNKIDTILITGNMDNVLNSDNKSDTATVNISRYCPSDSTKNFSLVNGMIRRHGQSTLNYPVPSLKMWFAKNNLADVAAVFTSSQVGYSKNRYKMKDTSIPANKFILQANYADSSGVQNGGLQRMINDSWYYAKFTDSAGNTVYRLRTAPQLFSSNSVLAHNDTNIYEDGYVEGYNKDKKQWIDYNKDKTGALLNAFPYQIRTTPDSFPCVVFYNNGSTTTKFLGIYAFMEDKKSDFNYGERSIYNVTKDPFCLMSANKDADSSQNQIWANTNVLRIEILSTNALYTSYMDDEDFIKQDTVNKIFNWQNYFEMIYPDPEDVIDSNSTAIESTKFIKKAQPFVDWFLWLVGTRNRDSEITVDLTITNYDSRLLDWATDNTASLPSTIDLTKLAEMKKNDPTGYASAISTIAGVLGTKGTSLEKKYINELKTTDTTLTSLTYTVGCYETRMLDWAEENISISGVDQDKVTLLRNLFIEKNKGTSNGTVSNTLTSEQLTDIYAYFSLIMKAFSAATVSNTEKSYIYEMFRMTAAQHLDLYKLAAYYIYVLRFGLVDSLERNAQIKTYDGIHFHYEPWDMDIGVGKDNAGQLVFDPPIDRSTKLAGEDKTYAISGRGGIPGDRNFIYTSNWMWDALEDWNSWADMVVPTTAQALYDATSSVATDKIGLSYDNISAMFEDNYSSKWSETMYNESEHYKYVEKASGSSLYAWLQGSGLTFRHWWLSTSMNYYDAKWACGDFKNHRIYIQVNHNINTSADEELIYVTPSVSTYISIYKEEQHLSTVYAEAGTKVSFNIAKIALSSKTPFYIYGAVYFEDLDLSVFANGLVNVTMTTAYSTVIGPQLRSVNIGVPVTVDSTDSGKYTGTVNMLALTTSAVNDTLGTDALKALETLNVRGQINYGNFGEFKQYDRSSLKNLYAMGSGITSFSTSGTGNTFDTIELPGQNIDKDGNVLKSLSSIEMTNTTWKTLSFYNTKINDSSGNATFTKLVKTRNSVQVDSIPSSMLSLTMSGTTCSNMISKDLVINWINSIIENAGSEYESDGVIPVLSKYTLKLSNINWADKSNLVTFDELSNIAKFNTLYVDTDGTKKVNVSANAVSNKGIYNMSGYILITNLGADGNEKELTSTQLTQIKEWFGESVFTRNSSGLIVDHNSNYIQINVGSLTNNVQVIDDKVCIEEGTSATLNATTFMLKTDDTSTYNWSIGLNASGEGIGQQIITRDDDNNPIYIASLSTNESTGMHILTVYETTMMANHSIYLFVVNNISDTDSRTASMELIVTPVTYPTSYRFDLNAYATVKPRVYSDYICLYQNEIYCELDLAYTTTDNSSFSATINGISFSITESDGTYLINNAPYTYFEPSSKVSYTLLGNSCLGYYNNPIKKYGLPIYSSAPDAKKEHMYDAYGTVKFKSGLTLSASQKIMVIDDTTAILTNDLSNLYNAISYKYKTQFNTTASLSAFYKSDLMSLTGKLEFTYNPSWKNITYLKTRNNKSLLLYLPNISELNMDGLNLYSTCPSIIDTTYGTNQMVFSKMDSLNTLSMQNCTYLSNDIDLSKNSYIQSVDLSGTKINAYLPTTSNKVSLIEYGSPSYISIMNDSSLSYSSIKVDSLSNIKEIDLENISSGSTSQTFSAFGKILGIY